MATPMQDLAAILDDECGPLEGDKPHDPTKLARSELLRNWLIGRLEAEWENSGEDVEFYADTLLGREPTMHGLRRIVQ